jgi:hypothetical protein
MNSSTVPKYKQALELRNGGLSYRQIAEVLCVKERRIREYLNKARHLDHKLALHREHGRRSYRNHLEENRRKRREYWKKDPERWHQEKLVTVINGKRVTFYHLHKRPRPAVCELCEKVRKRLYYHHWDDEDVNKGLWLCGQCHRFVTRIERGDVPRYLMLKERISEELRTFCPNVIEKPGLERLKR